MIMLSIRNGYWYYAIDTKSQSGAIIYGCEPEFDEVSKSFNDLLELIISNKIII